MCSCSTAACPNHANVHRVRQWGLQERWSPGDGARVIKLRGLSRRKASRQVGTELCEGQHQMAQFDQRTTTYARVRRSDFAVERRSVRSIITCDVIASIRSLANHRFRASARDNASKQVLNLPLLPKRDRRHAKLSHPHHRFCSRTVQIFASGTTKRVRDDSQYRRHDVDIACSRRLSGGSFFKSPRRQLYRAADSNSSAHQCRHQCLHMGGGVPYSPVVERRRGSFGRPGDS